ncbi:MAG: aldehyde dehydrogenase family protein, partial [Cellulosilyticaceae bacterium]
MKDLTEQLQLMHRFFNTRKTYDLKMRLYFLKKLKRTILAEQDAICKALYEDFKKPYFETYMTEIYTVLEELDTAIRSLKKWAKPKKHIAAFPLIGSTKIYPEPYGVCAIFAPYNYPFQLTLSPLIGALAAGNVIVVKPSEYTPHTSSLI